MKQRIANKLEAVVSTSKPGPKTEDAKNRVRHNAYTHGLTAQHLIISPDDQPVYDAIAEDFRLRFQPADGFESQLLQKIIDTNWRLEVCASVESALYSDIPYDRFADTKADPRTTYEAAIQKRPQPQATIAAPIPPPAPTPTLNERLKEIVMTASASASGLSQPTQNETLAPSNDLFRQNDQQPSADTSTEDAPPPDRV